MQGGRKEVTQERDPTLPTEREKDFDGKALAGLVEDDHLLDRGQMGGK